MGDLNQVNLNTQRKNLAADKEKLLKSNLQNNVIGNAFAVFIEQAIAKAEQKTDNQNSTNHLSQDKKKEVTNKKENNDNQTPVGKDYKIDIPQIKKNKLSAKKNSTTSASELKLDQTDLENLKEAFNLAGRRLEQFFSIGSDGQIELKKIGAVSKIDQARSFSLDDCLAEMIQNIKKAKAGNLNKLSITLKPDNLGEMEIFFTILEENQVKKVFISFAGNEEALNLLRSQQQQLADQLNNSGHFLGGLDFVLYGGSDHQREQGQSGSFEKRQNFVEDLLKSPDKQAIISTIDSYVSDLIVNYIT